jgi:membrane fusion protein
MRSTLFRAEAMQLRDHAWMGEVLLAQPLSMRLVAWCAMGAAVALFGFMACAEFTRRVPGSGTLVPDAGLVKVQSPRAGVVLQRLVREGEQVRAGQLLYVVSSEVPYLPAAGAGAAGVAARTLETVRARQQLLGQEAAGAAMVAREERTALAARVRGLQEEAAQLDTELGVERERLAARQAQYERYEQARREGFLSPLGLQQKYDEVLDQRSRVQAMLRTRLGLERDLADAKAALASADSKAGVARSQLEREALDARRMQAEQEATGHIAVTAPMAGTVGAVLAEPGQRVDGDTMLTLLPQGARLEAQLLLPPRAIGFVGEGDPVDLELGAFPHQAGARLRGVVTQVSRTTLAGTELARQDLAATGAGEGARYRVRVRLPVQALWIDGAQRPLRAGMDVAASFPQERRTLLRWLVQPLARWREAA